MGADNLAGFHRWDRWEDIMAAVPVGVLARPGEQLRAGLSPAARRFARWRLPQSEARALPFRAAAGLDAGHRADARPVVDRAPRAGGLAAVTASGRGGPRGRRRLPRRAGAAVAAATAAEPLEAILAASGLGASPGSRSFDLATGRLVEGHASDAPRPPASVAKIVTALYALDALGHDYRFRTRVLAAGPVEGGAVAGDLVLAGDGDPVLDTDGLRGLVAALRNGGLAAVGGRLLVAGGALPAIAEVDPGQPAERPTTRRSPG